MSRLRLWWWVIAEFIIFLITISATSLSWIQSSGVPVLYSGAYFLAMSSTGQYMIAASSLGVFCLTSNYGNSWSCSTSSYQWSAVSMSSSGRFILLLGSSTDGLCSTTYGNTWVATGLVSNVLWGAAAVGTSGAPMIAAVYGGNVYSSSDYGTTWTMNADLPATANYNGAAISATLSTVVLIVDYGGVYITTDGHIWAYTLGNERFASVSVSSSGQYMLLLSYGGNLRVSNTYGTSWTIVTLSGMDNAWKGSAMSSSGRYMAAVTYAISGNVYISNDFGTTWEAQTSLSSTAWNSVAVSASGDIIVAAGKSVYMSTPLPSLQPSGQPTSQPSRQPSRQPSTQPSSQPSTQPSSRPSTQPSLRPSTQPSSRPSRQPSNRPSSQPSGQPTSQPSRQPSRQPSTQPSTQPSSRPSRKPSSRPSSQPTQQPTRSPTSQPSTQPLNRPTAYPSNKPTNRPSCLPSGQPSNFPSGPPSRQPISYPSSQPSCQPSTKPSAQPSFQPLSNPSLQPSTQPTAIPSLLPSLQPSGKPSCQPSGQPSMKPTVFPSSQPSLFPSSQPSVSPSMQPTQSPTQSPTCVPSAAPSAQPSLTPSQQPSSLPTDQPSSTPTSQPTNRPSSIPSLQPTGQPSCVPTQQPSNAPSAMPSVLPSSQPSTQPSAQPSITPSSAPSMQPTAVPSDQPSGQPISRPTDQPTVQPSRQPTVQPSRQPSSQPSSQPSRQPSSNPTTISASRTITVFYTVNRTAFGNRTWLFLPTISLPNTPDTVTIARNKNDVDTSFSVSVTANDKNLSISTSSNNKSAADASLPSKVVSGIISVQLKPSNSSAVSVPVFAANVSVDRSAIPSVSSIPIFRHNCTEGIVESVLFVCPSSAVSFNLTCSGRAFAAVRRQCPVPTQVCNVLSSPSSGSIRVLSSDFCQATVSSGYVVCRCGFDVPRNSTSVASIIAAGGGVNVVVMTQYVAGDFGATVAGAGSISSLALARQSSSVFLVFGCLWGLGIALIGLQQYPSRDVERRTDVVKQKRVKVSRQQETAQVAPYLQSVAANIAQGVVQEQDKAVNLQHRLLTSLQTYMWSVLPSVYQPGPWYVKLLRQLERHHSYVRIVAAALNRPVYATSSEWNEPVPPSDTNIMLRLRQRESRQQVLHIFQVLTKITVSFFVLAVLYDLQYPSDDGSCAQPANNVDESSCLQRRSLLDPSLSYCMWHAVQVVSAGELAENRNNKLYQRLSIEELSEELSGEDSPETALRCRFNPSSGSSILSIVVSLVITSVLSVPLKVLLTCLFSVIDGELYGNTDSSAVGVTLGGLTREIGEKDASHSLRPVERVGDGRDTVKDVDMEAGVIVECSLSNGLSPNVSACIPIQVHVARCSCLSTYARVIELRGFPNGPSLHSISNFQRHMRRDPIHAQQRMLSQQQPLALSSDDHFGAMLLQSLFSDLLILMLRPRSVVPTDASSARAVQQIYEIALKHDFPNSYPPSAVSTDSHDVPTNPTSTSRRGVTRSRVLRLVSIACVLVINLGALYFVALKGVQRGSAWQRSFITVCLVDWVVDACFMETVEVLWLHVWLVGLISEEMQELLVWVQTSARDFVHGLLTDLPFELDAESVHEDTVSWQLAQMRPTLIEALFVHYMFVSGQQLHYVRGNNALATLPDAAATSSTSRYCGAGQTRFWCHLVLDYVSLEVQHTFVCILATIFVAASIYLWYYMPEALLWASSLSHGDALLVGRLLMSLFLIMTFGSILYIAYRSLRVQNGMDKRETIGVYHGNMHRVRPLTLTDTTTDNDHYNNHNRIDDRRNNHEDSTQCFDKNVLRSNRTSRSVHRIPENPHHQSSLQSFPAAYTSNESTFQPHRRSSRPVNMTRHSVVSGILRTTEQAVSDEEDEKADEQDMLEKKAVYNMDDEDDDDEDDSESSMSFNSLDFSEVEDQPNQGRRDRSSSVSSSAACSSSESFATIS